MKSQRRLAPIGQIQRKLKMDVGRPVMTGGSTTTPAGRNVHNFVPHQSIY
jgi:hypothetical protein